MRRAAFGLALVLSASPAMAETVAVLNGLDKVTARVEVIEAPVGVIVRFGDLEIIARACEARKGEGRNEAVAFLEIEEPRDETTRVRIFHGWMFAASPSINAMEHPTYDVWLASCATR